jgi:hypothetical protein
VGGGADRLGAEVIRRCDGSDRNLIARDGSECCACGLTFDDVERMVIWPHHPVGPKLTLAELGAVFRDTFGVDLGDVLPGTAG